MLFNHIEPVAAGATNIDPGTGTDPTFEIPAHLPFGNETPSSMRLAIDQVADGTVTVGIWAQIETAGDFAPESVIIPGPVAPPDRTWVLIAAVNLTTADRSAVIENLNRGHYYVNIIDNNSSVDFDLLLSFIS